jgi:hypothetical protein
MEMKMQAIKGEINESTRLIFLVERHRQLHEEVDSLQKQRFLSPFERDRLRTAKVMRLKAKEAVDKFRLHMQQEEI